MSEGFVRDAITGGENPDTDLADKIGTFSKQLEGIADDMAKAKNEDTARFGELKAEATRIAAELTPLKAEFDAKQQDTDLKAVLAEAQEWREYVASQRQPSKAHLIGSPSNAKGAPRGEFLRAVFEARNVDYDVQRRGKAWFAEHQPSDAKAVLEGLSEGRPMEYGYYDPIGAGLSQPAGGKATLGTTDPTGGWIIPNAIVDDLIKPAAVSNIYRTICTVVPGVTAFAVDVPFRSAARTRATVIAFGQTKENVDLVYNGYTATMYTIARVHDLGNQFLRQSGGAAEQDVLQELGAAFAQGESYYTRQGSGSSEPFGYTTPLTVGPAAFRTTFTPSATTLAGSMATAIATSAGALAGRGANSNNGEIAAVLSATSYWIMLSQGTDTAGFFFNPAGGPTGINAPAGTLVSPFGIPVYYDADADLDGGATVSDNLVVGNFKKLKVYFGQSYRVDSSSQAGTRWDTNVTGFRGEEEMGLDARPAVYAGWFQMVTDITP